MPGFRQAPWFAFYPTPESKIGQDLSLARRTRAGTFVSENGVWPVTAYRIKFVGRRKVSELLGLAPLVGFGYGHLSAFGSEVEVSRLISIEEIPAVMCDIR